MLLITLKNGLEIWIWKQLILAVSDIIEKIQKIYQAMNIYFCQTFRCTGTFCCDAFLYICTFCCTQLYDKIRRSEQKYKVCIHLMVVTGYCNGRFLSLQQNRQMSKDFIYLSSWKSIVIHWSPRKGVVLCLQYLISKF